VAGLAALVAGLAGGVERTTVGGGAVARNVAKLAAGIALHGLSLAVTGEVVGATALVASRRARAASEAATTAKGARVATTAHGSATTHRAGVHGVGASASKVAGLATVVAAAAGASATQTESGAVSLHVAESLAVVALLGLGGTGKRAAVGLVTRLLAVVAETLSRGANLGVVADVAALVACSTGEGRHVDRCGWFGE
jgi:hypothetical protein